MGAEAPPEHVPDAIANAFREAAVSMATGCWNAAATMFRLAISLSTGPLLPVEEIDGLTNKVRRDLGLRLPWLFNNGKIGRAHV